jgi:hypothetical protein
MALRTVKNIIWITKYEKPALHKNKQSPPSKQMAQSTFHRLNAELNPICHLQALLGTHPILHVSRIRFNILAGFCKIFYSR